MQVMTDAAAGILYALHIRGQKYGFSPRFLLFLQVGKINPKNYQKDSQNNLDDSRHHYDPADGIDSARADSDGPDLCR